MTKSILDELYDLSWKWDRGFDAGSFQGMIVGACVCCAILGLFLLYKWIHEKFYGSSELGNTLRLILIILLPLVMALSMGFFGFWNALNSLNSTMPSGNPALYPPSR